MTTATTRRVGGLVRANALLLLRNRLTLVYGLVLPLFPMALLLPAPRGDTETGAVTVSLVLVMAWLFSVFYNLLSLVVTRRDELVLKRLRTGEVTDRELLASLALPGVVSALVISLAVVPVASALGLRLPLNPVLYAATALTGCGLYAAFAIWTAAWTRTAEAAQMTSLPVMLLGVVGTMQRGFPEEAQRVVELTPGAALDTLVRVSWFGLGPDGGVGLGQSWGVAVQPLLVVVAWAVVATWLARRSLRWEPRP